MNVHVHHTLGNLDKYADKLWTPLYLLYGCDNKSIMNVGGVMRKIHIDFLLSEINEMIPDTIFEFQYSV